MQGVSIALPRPIKHRKTAHQARSDGDNHLIHQLSLYETSDDLAASFHHDASDSSVGKQAQQVRQVHPAKPVTLAADNFRSPVFYCTDRLRITLVGTRQPTAAICSIKKPGVPGGAQFAIKHYGLGVSSLAETNSQLGIVDQYRVDSNDDGIAGSADAMGQDHRLVAAQLKLFSVPGGDAAIHALGIRDGDQRAVMMVQPIF